MLHVMYVYVGIIMPEYAIRNKKVAGLHTDYVNYMQNEHIRHY